ncbi:hypothetical protein DFJ73DRAFT_957722 [Zopfochytrium polystomum]|nr:hypothetical protein DFJ73DRAFT_957722 [Zopfochytrium polystomum]
MWRRRLPSASPSFFSLSAAAVTALAAIAVAFLVGAAPAAADCTNPTVRREWSSLSSSQKSQYINAIKQLSKRPLSGQGMDASTPITDYSTLSLGDFTATHSAKAFYAHGNAQFFPYHRAMLWNFDQALQTVGWKIGPVYFDWALYSQSWDKSDLFSSAYAGTWTSSAADCLADGPFKRGDYNVSLNPPTATASIENTYVTRVYNGDSTCLRRNSHVGSALNDPVSLLLWYGTAGTYSDFRSASGVDDRFNWHSTVHETFGGDGDMANPYFSPNDPLFYFHHGMVDKIWFKWQSICDEYRTSYTGSLNSGGQASLNEVLDSWYIEAQDVIDTRSGKLCYIYEKTASDIPFTAPTCPGGGAPNLDPWAEKGSVDVTDKAANDSATPPAPVDSSQWLTQLVQALLPLGSGKSKSRRDDAAAASAVAVVAANATVNSTANANATESTTATFDPLAWTANVTVAPDKRSVVLHGVTLDVPTGYVLDKIFPRHILVRKVALADVANDGRDQFKVVTLVAAARNGTVPDVWTPPSTEDGELEESEEERAEREEIFKLFDPIAEHQAATAAAAAATATEADAAAVDAPAVAPTVVDSLAMPAFLTPAQLEKWMIDPVGYRLWENRVRKVVHYYNTDPRSQSPAVVKARELAAAEGVAL